MNYNIEEAPDEQSLCGQDYYFKELSTSESAKILKCIEKVIFILIIKIIYLTFIILYL